MKRTILLACIFVMVLFSFVFAECQPGTDWTVAWTDDFGNTTYTLTAPCKVYIGIPFSITATVSDVFCINSWVGSFWSIIDNGELIAGSYRQNAIWTDNNGQWQKVIERTYSGTPVDHLIEFRFTDHGICSGVHHSASNLIGHITLDPFPPGSNTPPAVNAGPDIILSSQDQAATVINGLASDADGDALSYRWLEGITELYPYQPVDISGNAVLSLGTLAPLAIGTHTFILEVSDGKDVSTDEVRVSMENSPPLAALSGGGTYQIWSDIPLTANVSDYDGDTIGYRWLEGTTLLASGAVTSEFGGSPVPLPAHTIPGGLSIGSHIVTLEVSDGIHAVVDNLIVNVVDTVAPTLSPSASAYILWPPNHKMVDVAVYANASDNSNSSLSFSVMVSSNEAPELDVNGYAIPDYYIVGVDQLNGVVYLQLRAAKAGNRNERIYTIRINAMDESGNSSSSDVLIKVPHDMRKK
jgi:hypothetical protein